MSLRHSTAIVGFLFLTITAGTYCWYYGFSTIAVLEAHYTASTVPIVREIPKPLPDSTVISSATKVVDFCSYSFKVPWTDLDGSKTKSTSAKQILYFGSGLVVVVTCSQPGTFVNTFLSSAGTNAEQFQEVFGKEPLKSDYALTDLMLRTTPGNITLRIPRKDTVATLSMLVVKSIAVPPADSGIFKIHTAEFDGFQYENPARQPKQVLVDLFAADQSLEFAFVLNHAGTTAHISQAEINRVIQTVHKLRTRSSDTRQPVARMN